MTHVGLREILVPKQWLADNTKNFCTAISPSGTAVAVASGDERTGQVGNPSPRTRYPKGPRAEKAVANNQLSLLPQLQETAPARPLETWYLLIATNGNTVRYELSFPQGIGEDGRIHSWSERIICAPLVLDGQFLPDEDNGPDFDIPVERR